MVAVELAWPALIHPMTDDEPTTSSEAHTPDDPSLPQREPATGQSRTAATLITGANGEFGHGLIHALFAAGQRDIIALDVRGLDDDLRSRCRDSLIGDICDQTLLDRISATYEIHTIYHLAALLSTRAEFVPETAHRVNVDGTRNLLHLAVTQALSQGRTVRFAFPSSIAVYGLPDPGMKNRIGPVEEIEWLLPTTMYGCNKLACEHLGRYYARHYRQLAKDRPGHDGRVDFRAIRFPGVISAFTLPSGGTSDYAPEMIHAAAQSTSYVCFVRADARIPFITMPDAIDALIRLARAPAASLTRCVYNITAFNPSAAELSDLVGRYFPDARITFSPDRERQAIVDTWPAEVDDSAARSDWGHAPKHSLETAFSDYLIPNIKAKYSG